MRDVFIVEPMAEPRILAALIGQIPTSIDRRAAVLPGHATRASADGLRVAACRAPESRAPGFLLTLGTEARARLEFWMAAIGASPLVAGVIHDGEKQVVDTFVLSPRIGTRDWREADWRGEWQDLVAEAVEEIERLFGEKEPKDLPGLLVGVGYRALGRARGARRDTAARFGSDRGRADVDEISLDPAYVNYFAVEEHLLRFRRFDGEWSAPVERAAFTSGDATTILPFDPIANTVLLVEQFRAGPNARRDPRPWLLECVAGRCDPMETAEATARREAIEEAGLEIGRLECVGAYYSSPAATSEFLTSFVGEANLSAGGGEFGLAVEDEDIRGVVVPLDEALAAMRAGEIINAPLLISLLWLEHHAARLRREWGGAE